MHVGVSVHVASGWSVVVVCKDMYEYAWLWTGMYGYLWVFIGNYKNA